MRGKVSPLEVVEVNYLFPSGRYLAHPALVISTEDLFEEEEMFYAVLMTTKNVFPQYTIEIKPEWLTKTTSRTTGYFATHMLNMFTMKDVLTKSNTFLKAEHFPQIRQKIIASIFHHG